MACLQRRVAPVADLVLLDLRGEVDALKVRVRELEKLAHVVTLPAGAKRNSLVQRVLAGASRRMAARTRGVPGCGHRWICKRIDPLVRLGYSFALAGAVAKIDDVARQVNRATSVMQDAAALIEGIPLDQWVESRWMEPLK